MPPKRDGRREFLKRMHEERAASASAAPSASAAAVSDELAGPDWMPRPSDERSRVADDRRLDAEMLADVVDEDDEGARRPAKRRAPDTELDPSVREQRARHAAAQARHESAKKETAQWVAQSSNRFKAFFSAPEEEKKPQAEEQPIGVPVEMSAGSCVAEGARVSAPTEPPPPTLTAAGKRRGRPRKAAAVGSCSTAAAYASHGGVGPSAMGRPTTGKAERRELRRRGRAAARERLWSMP
eukprot:4300755-Prymnesium_polylepis.1